MNRRTLAGGCEAVLEVKKSRFVAHAAPVDAAEAALAYLEQIADRTATHNCWAYRIGQALRFSDDGEPGGTAGRPILAAIDGSGLDGVVVVVTRWYGGIKLGAGGLVRAYGGAAAECLRLGAQVELIDQVDIELRCEFALAGAVHGLLKLHAAEKVGERFEAEGMVLALKVPADQVDSLAGAIRDASRGRARLARLPDNDS
jgi:uncharacterized YigZ family protein